ncbi:MAG TPA: hypothetical protein VFG04_17965 [Planctomycetaceae bacterium]|nr:hypothetical protein [Planctomycetaceae bacterium]
MDQSHASTAQAPETHEAMRNGIASRAHCWIHDCSRGSLRIWIRLRVAYAQARAAKPIHRRMTA